MQTAAAVADLAFLKQALEDRFAYLHANGVDHEALFAELRQRLPAEVDPNWLGLELQKLLAHFIDGHAATNVRPAPLGFLPFLTGSVGNDLVAFTPDRAGLLDPDHPFLVAIDGVDTGDWLAAASKYVAAGSAQLVRRESQRWLRACQMLRLDMGLPQTAEVTVVMTSVDGSSLRTHRLPILDQPPQFGSWPRPETKLLDGNIGYLRLAQMRPEASEHIRGALVEFESATELVIDVRRNGGGTRGALLTLLTALMGPDEPPRVVNVAAFRKWDGFPSDHLAARHLYPVNSGHWTADERSALETFMAAFSPEWLPPADEFSEWHAMVISATSSNQLTFRDRPVAVLMDAGCFSATDVFLSALKGLPNVTLVGQASSGGSARAQVVKLPNSGVKARFASMASFQPNGRLFDGHGVVPDVEVEPAADYFVTGGHDNVLEHAVSACL